MSVKAEMTAIDDGKFFAFEIAEHMNDLFHVWFVPELKSSRDRLKGLRWSDNKKWYINNANFIEIAIAKEIPTYKSKSGSPLKPTRSVINEVLEQIKIHFQKSIELWDKETLVWIGDKVINIDTSEEFEWSADLLCTQQRNFELIPEADLVTDWIEELKKVTDDWEILLNHYSAIIKNYQLPYMIVTNGNASSGKSPWLKVIKNIMGHENVGIDQITNLGKKGGMATSYDKNVLVQTEMNMSWLGQDTINIIKSIFSDDGMITVRLLYSNAFSIKAKLNIIGATNQCAKLAEGVDENGFFKRVYVIDARKNIFEDNPAFLEWIQSTDIINQIGSYCFHKEIINYREEMGLSNFQHLSKSRWQESSFPVYNIIKKYYERSYEIDDFVFQSQMINKVQQKLVELGVSIPSNFIGEITSSINLMGGSKVQRDKKAAYLGLKRKKTKKIKDTSAKDLSKEELDALVEGF